MSLWNREGLVSFLRVGIFGVQIGPAVGGWQASLFFWSHRENGGPSIGFYDGSRENAEDRAFDDMLRILASAIPCACDYAEPCATPSHVEEANDRKVGAL